MPGLLRVDQPCVQVALGSVDAQVQWLAENRSDLRFKLIYCDPPFFSNKDYGSFTDQWSSLEEYLAAMREWMDRMAPWLDRAGFFVLHCDYHASHYLKLEGDRIWGYGNFRNEWIWHYGGRRTPAGLRVNSKHDVLLVWANSPHARFNPVFDTWDRDAYVAMKRQKVHTDEEGREWIWGHRGRGQSHAYRIYLDEQVGRGRAIDSVWDIPIINTSAKERVGYPTQKPLRLMQRIIALTTRPGDRVADFACGSGTTAVAAHAMDRMVWAGDQGDGAIELTVRRLAAMDMAIE